MCIRDSTAALLISAAATSDGGQLTLLTIGNQLRPALGSWAEPVVGVGLLAAGLTSAITAPIAAGYAAAGCFGWNADLSDKRMQGVAILVIVLGLVVALGLGETPLQAIIVAQVANGLLLPIIAIFLLVTLNRSAVMGDQKNGLLSNLLGLAVVAFTVIIALRQFNLSLIHI